MGPPGYWVFAMQDTTGGATPKHFKTTGKDEGPSPLNSMECGAI